MFTRMVQRSLVIAIFVVCTLTVVTARPWEGDTNSPINDGGGTYQLLETCLQVNCPALVGTSLVACSRHACRFATSTRGDVLDLLTCADTQCGAMTGWQYRSCVSTQCVHNRMTSDVVHSTQSCIKQCRDLQPTKSLYNCITSVCLATHAPSDDVTANALRLPSKRWVDRITCPTQCSSFAGADLYRCCNGK